MEIPECFLGGFAMLSLGLLAVGCSAASGSTQANPVVGPEQARDAQVAIGPLPDAGPVTGSPAPADASAPPESMVTRPPGSCGGAAYKAIAKELEVFVLFDSSYSMLLPVLDADCLNTGVIEDCASDQAATLWDVAVAELSAFVRDPKSAGISLALKYFGTDCNPSFYATPDVKLGKLPEHAAAIEQSLAAVWPLDETATRPALEGAVAYARARASEPGYNARQIIVLVTDGYPDELDCPNNTTQAVSEIAAKASAGEPRFATYVFVTVPEVALDPVAQAGGTERALVADLNKVGALSAALGAVRDQELAALPCEYELPEAYFTDVNDPGMVNLTRDGEPIGRVDSAAACAADANGWYYDDPAAPRRILTCAAACASLKSASKVDVQLQCPTVLLL